MDLSNIDLQQVGEAGTALKTMFDAVRSAIGIAKDARAIKQTSPDDQQAFDNAIDRAEQAASLAQAQVAQLLGYQLCRCTFPPAVMLTVGTFNGRAAHIPKGAVHQCPSCGLTDNQGWSWTPTANRVDQASPAPATPINGDQAESTK
jgi:hypothetical protein